MSYKRKKQDNCRLKKLYKETTHGKRFSICGVYYNPRKKRYIRIYPSSTTGFTKWLRKRTNKKIRQTNDIFQYGDYRKLYDY